MKLRFGKHFRLLTLLCLGNLLATGRVAGQFLFTDCFNFPTNSQGYALEVNGGLVADGNVLYGTTQTGGTQGSGAVFSVHTDGTGYQEIYSFSAYNSPPDYAVTNGDGAVPNGGLVLSGNTLYGTARYGGTNGSGTVFAVNTNGTGFTTLYHFTSPAYDQDNYASTNADGAGPQAGLSLAGGALYGTAYSGGSGGSGTVFKLNPDGSGFTVLASFDPLINNPLNPNFSIYNTAGAQPKTRLVVDGDRLYGTTSIGGPSEGGTVFAVSTNGGDIYFAVLHSFTSYIDGLQPNDLTLATNVLYGTTAQGGPNYPGVGTLYSLKTDGNHDFALLTNFNSLSGGENPAGGLVLSSNALFGVTQLDASNSAGTVFAINTDGSALETLYTFSPNVFLFIPPAFVSNTNTDGASPNGLILAGNVLYGTTAQDGTMGGGTVFSLDLGTFRSHQQAYHPRLDITSQGSQVVVKWPTNDSTFRLQSTTNLANSDSWSQVLPDPVVVNGNFTVTNAITNSQMFYQLSHP